MLRSPNRATLFRIGTIFAVLSSVVYSKNASAEDAQALVVVIDAADQDSVKRIGRQHVRVEVLFAEESEAETGDYAACNKRVQGLLEFRLLLRGEKQCVTQKFWQERMSAANPKARVHRLSQSRPATEIEHRIQRAKDIHHALASTFPEKRKHLEANLKSEVNRLESLRRQPRQLALLR